MNPEVSDKDIRTAELEHILAQTEKEKAERRKLEKEEAELSARLSLPWWHISLKTLLQVVIAGVVAGILIGSFLLDHFLKVSDLLAKQQTALQMQIKEGEESLAKQQEQNLLDRNNNIEEREALNKQLAELDVINNNLQVEIDILKKSRGKTLDKLKAALSEKKKELDFEKHRGGGNLEEAVDRKIELYIAQIDMLGTEISDLEKEITSLSSASLMTKAISSDISKKRILSYLQNYAWVLSVDSDKSSLSEQFVFWGDGSVTVIDRVECVHPHPKGLRWSSISAAKWTIEGGQLVIKVEARSKRRRGYSYRFPQIEKVIDVGEISGRIFSEEEEKPALLQHSTELSNCSYIEAGVSVG